MVLSWTSRFLLSNFHFLILKSRNHHKHLRLGDDGTQKHLEAPWGGSHWYFAQLCAEAVINICQTERDEITRQQDRSCLSKKNKEEVAQDPDKGGQRRQEEPVGANHRETAEKQGRALDLVSGRLSWSQNRAQLQFPCLHIMGPFLRDL